MPQRLRTLILLLACTVAGLYAPTPACAQTTGGIEGRALDPSGAGLAGVQVEARSSSLQGVRTAITDANGGYRLPGLPPGTYTVRASLKAFTTVEKTARVSLNFLATADFILEPSLEESVVVSGETPTIDLQSAATGTTYPATVLRRIAIIRNYADIVRLQPGVQPDTAATQGRAAPLAIYGSTSIENLYLIDGVNTNDIKQSFQGTVLPPESIEEVEVKTGGYGAEYGHAIGGIINAVTRSGGNTFHGDAFGYYNSPGMRADVKVTEQDILAAEQTTIDRWDAGLAVGGYVLKDRLWFFGSYDHIGQTTDRIPEQGPAAGGVYPFDSESNVYPGKLTWNAGQSTRVVATVFGDPEERTGATGPLASTDPLTYTATRNLGGPSYAAELNQIFGPSMMLSLQYSGHEDGFLTTIPPEANFPRVTDLTVPGLRSFSGGFGNVNGPFQNQSSRRDTVVSSLTSFLGNHELKLGGAYERSVTSAATLRSGDASLTIRPCKANPANPESVDRCATEGGTGVPYVNFQGQPVTGGVFFVHDYLTDAQGNPVTEILGETPIKAYSAYLQDHWRISPSLTLSAGLRWEREQIANWKGEQRIDLNNQWAPRVGVVWDFLGDGTSKALASYGRFYYSYPTDLNARAFGRSDFFGATTVNYDRDSLVDDPLAPRQFFSFGAPSGDEPIDTNLKGMYQDEFTIGVEKALAPTFVVGLKANYQRLASAIEDRCDLDYHSPETGFNGCAIINPGSSEPTASGALPCHNGNDRPADARIYPGPADDAVCNENGGPAVPRASRLYRGLELTARYTMADRLWIQAWYVYSSLRGNYDGAASLRDGQTDPGINADFDYWQFNRSNSSGKLYLDRPHAFQLAATYLAPFGLMAGFTGYVRSGPPRNQLLFFNEFYLGQLYGVPRGSFGRAATQYEINLAVGYQLRLGPVTVTPRLFVYNLLNRQGETRIQDDFNPTGDFDANGNDIQHVDFGKVLERQEPRLIRLGVRVSF
jgi:Carboxypeptidase regulatory-like domain/TonB-dependent Receptor Plug Domain